MGNFVEAYEYFVEATALFVRMGITWHVEIPLVASLGVTARLQGDLDQAERLLTQYLSTARQVGYQRRIAIKLHDLARLRHDSGHYPRHYAEERASPAYAISAHSEALPIARVGVCRWSAWDSSEAALEAFSSGESIIFVQKPFGLFCHKDADFFPLEGEGYPQPSQVMIRDVDLQIERLLVDPRSRGHALVFDARD